MKFGRALLIAALLPLALSSCKDQKLRDALEVWIEDDSARKGLVEWQTQLGQVICNVELYVEQHPGNSGAFSNPNWRLCPHQARIGAVSADPVGVPSDTFGWRDW
jgi:hypothetical protein